MISSLPKFSATCNARPRTGNLIFFRQGLFFELLEHSAITDFRIFDLGIDSAGFKDQQNAELLPLRAVQNIYSPAEGNEGGIKDLPGGIGVQA